MIRQYVVTGMVQGVGYRWFVRECARRLDISGWVRNEPDGSVLVMAIGDQSQQEALFQQLQIGPPAARVANVHASEARGENGSRLADDAGAIDSGTQPFYLVR